MEVALQEIICEYLRHKRLTLQKLEDDLPIDCKEIICGFCDINTLFKLSQTNQSFRKAASEVMLRAKKSFLLVCVSPKIQFHGPAMFKKALMEDSSRYNVLLPALSCPIPLAGFFKLSINDENSKLAFTNLICNVIYHSKFEVEQFMKEKENELDCGNKHEVAEYFNCVLNEPKMVEQVKLKHIQDVMDLVLQTVRTCTTENEFSAALDVFQNLEPFNVKSKVFTVGNFDSFKILGEEFLDHEISYDDFCHLLMLAMLERMDEATAQLGCVMLFERMRNLQWITHPLGDIKEVENPRAVTFKKIIEKLYPLKIFERGIKNLLNRELNFPAVPGKLRAFEYNGPLLSICWSLLPPFWDSSPKYDNNVSEFCWCIDAFLKSVFDGLNASSNMIFDVGSLEALFDFSCHVLSRGRIFLEDTDVEKLVTGLMNFLQESMKKDWIHHSRKQYEKLQQALKSQIGGTTKTIDLELLELLNNHLKQPVLPDECIDEESEFEDGDECIEEESEFEDGDEYIEEESEFEDGEDDDDDEFY